MIHIYNQRKILFRHLSQSFHLLDSNEKVNHFILYSENQCISKLDKIGIFIDMKNLTDIKSHWYQKSLVTDISLYLHCRFWNTSDVSIYLTSLNVSHFEFLE